MVRARAKTLNRALRRALGPVEQVHHIANSVANAPSSPGYGPAGWKTLSNAAP